VALAILGGIGPAEGRDDPRAPRRVRIVGYAYSPRTITVTRGTRVVWTNADRAAHSVTARARTWGSGTLTQGGSFGRTFRRAGTFRYFCAIHPEMHGTVRVT
jgi:plastocyanin